MIGISEGLEMSLTPHTEYGRFLIQILQRAISEPSTDPKSFFHTLGMARNRRRLEELNLVPVIRLRAIFSSCQTGCSCKDVAQFLSSRTSESLQRFREPSCMGE